MHRMFMRSFSSLLPLFCLAFVMNLTTPQCQAQTVPFESGRWNLTQAEVKEHRGRSCLTGTAFLNGVKLRDGVIEVDVLVTGKASSPGIIFRHSSENDFERIYLRPHRAGHYPDAVQYSPTFNGAEAWQLYNGAGYTADCYLPPDNWVRLRLEFRDTQARLFVGGNATPSLVVPYLKHAPTHGSLGLDAPNDGSAFFSRFSYHENDKLEFPPAPAQVTLPGTVTRWELSPAFTATAIDMEKTPKQQKLAEFQWTPVESEENGLVNVARFRARSGGETNRIWARTIIRAEDDGARKLQFGYSDAISIFCNGKLLFSGSNAYQQRDASALGIAGYFDAVYLPLKSGENEILFCVEESSGGWGFMARAGVTEP